MGTTATQQHLAPSNAQVIQNYVLLKDLGSGEIGSVHLSQKIEEVDAEGNIVMDGEPVALKLLKPEFAKDAAYRRLFKREAESASALTLPGISKIRDVVMTEDILALVYDYVEGHSLEQEIPKDGMTLVEVLDILEPIADALDRFHDAKIVHGNIVPRNILIKKNGDAILTDMGTHKQAKWMQSTDVGIYRSPEHIRSRQSSRHSDLYSLGLIVYQMLSGQLPWDPRLKEEKILWLKDIDRLVPLSTCVPKVDVELLAMVMNMLMADPAARPKRCSEFIRVLQESIEREEQSTEIPYVDPEVLAKAKKEVSELDRLLAGLSKKLSTKEQKIIDSRRVRDTTIQRSQKKHEDVLAPWTARVQEADEGLAKLVGEVGKALFSEVGEQEGILRERQAAILGSLHRVHVKDFFMLGLILFVLLLTILDLVSPLPLIAFFVVDTFCCLLFLGNFFFELHQSDSRKWYWKTHWIDFITSIPIPPGLGNTGLIRAGRALRLVRMFRMIQFSNLLRVFKLSKKAKEKHDQQVAAAEAELDALRLEFDKQKEKADERLTASVEKARDSYEGLEAKLSNELIPLREEHGEQEDRLMKLGEIHPKLLGFRAKKPFSRADVIVGRAEVEMILLPRGNYMMGAMLHDEDSDYDENPSHMVTVNKEFWFGTVPVTQALYRAMTGKNPSFFKSPFRPVETVSWFDAVRFCNALSAREGLPPVYELDSINDDDANVRWNRASVGYRLPTEAEWEYAARALKEDIYCGSDEVEDVGWFADNSEEQTQEVAQLEPNAWGLYDLSGNVWEWCWDWKGPYTDVSMVDPTGPTDGMGRVFRGGSWIVDHTRLRVTCRGFERPHNRLDGIGFRIVRNTR
jgi:formylglycine-generating enzyme